MATPIHTIVSMAALAIMSTHNVIAADMAMPATGARGAALSAADKKMIKSAMRAAPKQMSAAATRVVIGADGQMRTLREGTNGFTCMPDNPTTPGPDPMCMEKAAMEWAGAWMSHKTPASGKVGFMYMLSGGTDASNTDPYAQNPAPTITGSRLDRTS